MTHNIFDWVLGERQRMFMTRRLCRDILEGILTETVTHIGKEMATNVMEKVLSKVMVEATVNKLMKEEEEYGHEVITGLEYKFNEKRMEEEISIKKMLDEMQREERLEIQRRKKEDWRVSYWRLQDQEMTVQMRNLSLLEQAIFMEWETDTDTVVLEEMDTLLNNLKRTVCQKNPVTDYNCDVCDKRFDKTTDFKEHVKIHNEKVLHM